MPTPLRYPLPAPGDPPSHSAAMDHVRAGPETIDTGAVASPVASAQRRPVARTAGRTGDTDPDGAPVDLVIFDCDGVLVDSEGLSGEGLIAALARLGIDLDFATFCTRFVGRSFPTVAQDIRRSFDVALPDDFERSYRADLRQACTGRLKATSGVQAVIEGLRVPFCVATSSSPERVAHSLQTARLDHYFPDVVFTASEVARGKPAPDLFLHVAARMGVDPAACLVIEDSLPGIEGGLAADMRVLRYTGGVHLRGQASATVASVAQFDDWQDLFQIVPGLR